MHLGAASVIAAAVKRMPGGHGAASLKNAMARRGEELFCRFGKGWQFSDVARIVLNDEGGLQVRGNLFDTID